MKKICHLIKIIVFRTLKLTLLEAYNLAKKDLFGMSDPYVVINLTDMDNPNLEGN